MLVRHGESAFVRERRFTGRLDVPLTPDGERQAGRVAARLADPRTPPPLPLPEGPPVGCWHSPLGRAAQTATQIAAARSGGLALHPSPGLVEMHQGDWEGRPLADVEASDEERLTAWRRDPLHHRAPDGESLQQGARRVRAALRQVIAELQAAAETGGAQVDGRGDGRGDGRPAADAARRAALRSTVPGYDTLPRRDPWAILVAHDGIFRVTLLTLLGLPLARFWSFPFALCGITIVDLRGGRALLRAHNLTDHLSGVEGGAGAPAPGETAL